MRTVEIDDNGILVNAYCPMAQLHRTDRLNCGDKCAWFAIGPETVVCDGVSHPNTGDKFAFCKDHIIGVIKNG